MMDRIGKAIATADGADFENDPARYRRLALAALGPLVRPTEAMVDAAHEVVWFDACWIKKAVRATIRAAMERLASPATGDERASLLLPSGIASAVPGILLLPR